jgi:hypothetical protein
MLCSKITSVDIIAFAQALKVQPQTVQNYLSHLGAVFAICDLLDTAAGGNHADRMG